MNLAGGVTALALATIPRRHVPDRRQHFNDIEIVSVCLFSCSDVAFRLASLLTYRFPRHASFVTTSLVAFIGVSCKSIGNANAKSKIIPIYLKLQPASRKTFDGNLLNRSFDHSDPVCV